MRPPPSDAERLARRSLFGDAAEDYAAVRPGYPDVVVEWIAERVPLGPATRILEVGCGTGQATRLLAGPGCRITALEPHPALAAIAKRELNTPAIAVVESTFEGFAAPPGNYDVVVCAASYHWLDPGTRADSLARLLRPLVPWRSSTTSTRHRSRASSCACRTSTPGSRPRRSCLRRRKRP